MTSPSALTWWEEREAFVSRAAENDLTVEDPPFSADLLALLADVEDAFAQTGADTPGWEDPHHDPTAPGERRDSRDEEYSRCSDPGKYRILWTRAEAWTRVLTARGWADAVEIEDGAQVSWAVDPLHGPLSHHGAAPPSARSPATRARPHRPGRCRRQRRQHRQHRPRRRRRRGPGPRRRPGRARRRGPGAGLPVRRLRFRLPRSARGARPGDPVDRRRRERGGEVSGWREHAHVLRRGERQRNR